MHRSLRLLRPTALPSQRVSSLLATRPVPPQWRGLYTTPIARDTTKGVDYQHATSKASEEVKGVAKDFAEMISGKSTQAAAAGAREISSHTHAGNVREDFVSITQSMITAVPKPILYFGLAGTIPYLGTSVGTVLLAREAAAKTTEHLTPLTSLDLETALSYLHTLEHVQITYGAVILSFLGALHWGMEFAKLGGIHSYRRLVVGTIPLLIAWPSVFLSHGLALIVQWCGFTGTWFLDQRASAAGWTPYWYSTYRFYLSIIVGFSIIGTLAGTGYYGAGAGAVDAKFKGPHYQHTTERTSALKRLDRVKEKNFPTKPGSITGTFEGKVGGDIETHAEESGDGYVHLTNTKEAAEKAAQEKKQAEEKRAKAEKQDKKDEHQMDKAPGTMKDDAKDRTGANKNVEGGEGKKEEGGAKGNKGVGEQGKVDSKEGGKGEEKSGDGKSQAKLDNPDAKGEAGKEPTGRK